MPATYALEIIKFLTYLAGTLALKVEIPLLSSKNSISFDEEKKSLFHFSKRFFCRQFYEAKKTTKK